MGKFKQEVIDHLQTLKRELSLLNTKLLERDFILKELKIELDIQRDENKRLRDAFMAQDFEKFKIYSSDQDGYNPRLYDDRVVSQADLDAFAGEAVDEDLSKQLTGEENAT